MSFPLKGKTIGFLGGGQLARMMGEAAQSLGAKIRVLDPNPKGSAGLVADSFVQGNWDDARAAFELSEKANVVTIDTEHIPAINLKPIEEKTPVFPASDFLAIVQNRSSQRAFLRNLELPQPQCQTILESSDLDSVSEDFQFPVVLKTTTQGYDGKGQIKVDSPTSLLDAWTELGQKPVVAEEWINYEKEASIVFARSQLGEIKFYPLAENEHRHHILHRTIVCSDDQRDPKVVEAAHDIAKKIAEKANYVGVMAIEFFLMKDGSLLINEIAPRVHNSGHYTLGGCKTSQFEQHIRAITGLELGSTDLLMPFCVMLNLVGEDWNAHPRFDQQSEDCILYDYRKSPARSGRKMGHLLFKGEKLELLLSRTQ